MATKKQPSPMRTYSLDDLISEGIRYTPEQAPAIEPQAVEPTGLIRRIAGDGILTAVKGAIGVPEAAVGLADIVTGGSAGKLAEDAGFRPKEAKAMLDQYYSPEQKAAFAAVQNAANPEDGLGQRIVDTGAAALQNPSTIVHAVGESLPLMAAGGVIGRGVMAMAPKAAGHAAAGIGEGVMSIGNTAEQVRQQTADGYLTGQQSMLAAGSGALTGGLGIIAGKAAKSMGIGDIDTLLVGGAAVPQAVQKGFTRKLLEGAFTEGVMEELPQSIQEQVAQNYALGKPLDEGVDQAVVMGLLSGGAMGMGAQVLHGSPKVAEVGPLSRAANTGIDNTPPAPAPVAPVPLSPEQEQALLDHANQRAQAIKAKAEGTKDQKITGPDDKPMIIPGKQPEFLTPKEKEEQAFLAENGGDAQALVDAYPGLMQAPKVSQVTPNSADPVSQVTPETPPQVSQVTPTDPVEVARQQNRKEQAALEAQAAQAEQDRINALIEQEKAQQAAQPDDNFWAGNEPLVTDLKNPKGEPFKTKGAAVAAQKREGAGEVVPVNGGYVVRVNPQPTTLGTQTNAVAGPGFGVSDVVKKQPVAPVEQASVDIESVAKEPTFSIDTMGWNASELAKAYSAEQLNQLWQEVQLQYSNRMVANSPVDENGMATKQRLNQSGQKIEAALKSAMGIVYQRKKSANNTPTTPTVESHDLFVWSKNKNTRHEQERTNPYHYGVLAAKLSIMRGSKDGIVSRYDDKEYKLYLDGYDAENSRSRTPHVSTQSAPTGVAPQQPAQPVTGEVDKVSPPTQEAPASPDTLVKVKDISGKHRYVKQDELNGDEPKIRVFTQNGVGIGRIHRDNLDLTGEKLAAANADNAANPLFDVITTKNGGTFATIAAAKRELNVRAIGNTHEVVKADDRQPGAKGFLIVKKTDSKVSQVTDQGDGINDSIRALRAKSFKVVKQGGPRGDVRLSTGGEYVSFDDAVAEARKAVAGGVKAVPFQIHNALDVNIGETDRIIAALGDPVVKPVTPQVDAPVEPASKATKDEGQYDELDAEMQSYENKPTIVTDKAEMRPYRKPDGSVGYEAVPIQDETPVGEGKVSLGAKAPSANTIFTEDAAAAARARLKAKLGRANSGLDPEMMMDGITLAGYHIEKGARTFAAYAKAMIDDLGDGVKPYLKSWYMGVRYDPRATAFDGMDSASTIDEFDIESLENSVEKADTEQKDTQNDSSTTNPTPALDNSVAEGQRPAGSETPTRGAKPSRAGKGRSDDGSVRRDGQPRVDESVNEGRNPDGTGRTDSVDQYEASRGMAGGLQRVSADFIPDVGGLTRKGSWFETAKRNIDLIELAIKIESENRAATKDEQAQLAKYVGFGASAIRNDLFPVPPAYAKAQQPNRLIWPEYVRNDRFKPLAERIDALPREWQQSILQSSQYAHYTSEGIIRSVWSALQRMGFTGGNVFEPGMGIGSFAMLMPNTIRNTSRYTGVEFDAPTALIARLLSPDQNMIHGDFIKKRFPENFFDVNVGNPPFSQTKILGDPKYAKNGFMLHDFFFAKGIDLVRPGGIQVFVTSKGTMDKQSDKARKYLSDRADLLGAIRLPSTAFEDNAGTSVVTDVIFLRKRAPGEPAAGEAWAGTTSVETKDGPVLVNEYFAKHPDMVLGQQRISGNTDDMGRRIDSNGMGGEKYTVVSYDTTADELDAKFAQAIEKLPENAYSVMGQSSKSIKDETAKIDFDPSVKREGVIYAAKDGTIMRVEQGVGKPLDGMVKLSDKDKAWLKGYVGLRDLVQESRFAQLNDGAWENSLAKLNKAHDVFVKEHGFIKDFRVITRKSTDEDGNVISTEIRVSKNKRLFSEDYDQALVTSLEDITEDGTIVKAPFLKGRTIGKPVARDVRTIGDALAVSLDEHGALNLDDVAHRMKLSRDEVIDSLGTQVYQTPTGQWQLADEYLAGDVVAKLEEAEQAAQLNPELKRNIEALKAVQPEKLGPSQISAKLGASWIPESHVNEFAQEIGAGLVTFDPKTEAWNVQGGNERSARNAGAEYGTAKRSPSELLEAILNSRSIKIMQTVDKKTVQDAEATTAANEMAKKIKDKFKGWVWTDTSRATELVESYNRNFNNIAPRRFDGSHLTLPGVSLRYKLHPHQLRAIWRMIQTGNTYLAHAVGAGKTIEMIAGGMEQKRLGLIKKPMYVVPNHMLEQFSNEFMELYPLANIMVADDENFSADRRKAFIASATMNNPDAIIITHDAFQRIGVKEESVAPIRDEILADLEIELSETAKDNESRVRRGQLQQQIEAVTQRFDKIIGAGQKDSTIKFEDMGVDFVYADEAHVFRKLDFHTAQTIKGIDPNGSKRALDMYVKTRILEKNKPGRSFSFASGTPVTNTMGELYTIMRFFAGAELEKSGISTFDAWARQFGEVVAALEPNAAGAYQIVERFAKFDNVPELMSRVRQFMDVLTSDNLGALVKRPDLAGGKPNLNIIPTNAALTEYMKGELAKRIEISKAWKPSPNEKGNPDPIVSIITDGRFAAIDPRFFGGKMQEGETSIITEMGDKVVQSYHATKNNIYTDKEGKPEAIKGSTQVVFYNLGFGEGAQRSRGFDARSAFTKRLTDGGIPRNEIAWFDDANTDAKKEAVFKDMRSGKLKVLIGSAKKMGTGVNVQKRLAVLHYQDPPWFPADVEQPHGRIIRQGNQNGTVAIEWYTTKGTYQSTMWQMVGRKQRFIDQAFTGDKTMRSMDDLGEASLFEQAAAVAAGDPRAIQLAGLKQDVERFERLQAAHASEQISVQSNLRSAKWQVEHLQKRINQLSKAFKAIGERYVSFTSGGVGGKDYAKPGEFGQAVKDAFNKISANSVMSAELVQDKQLASFGNGILVKMDSSLGKNNVPDGKFDLYVDVGGMTFQIGNAAAMGVDVDAAGLTRRIINQVNSVSSDLSDARRKLIDEETDVTKLSKKLGAPFEHQQEMAEKYGELKRLEAELKAEGEAKPEPELKIDQDGAVFSRGTSATGLTSPQVNSIVSAITERWGNAPEIVIAANMADTQIPQSVRDYNQKQKSLGATGEPEGFVHGGKVYLLADQLATPAEVMRVLFHESLGHMGLRGVFGNKLDGILKQLAGLRQADVAAKAAQYGLDMSIEADRLLAAEEVLAELAQTKPELGYVQRAISLIRGWLRAHVPGLQSMKLTNSDIIAQFILPARRFIEGGGVPKGGKKTLESVTSDTKSAFGRGTNEAMTNNDVVGNQGGRSADDSTPGDVTDFSKPSQKWGDLFFGDATPEKVSDLNKWLKQNPNSKIRMYHGTSVLNDIENQGVLRTSSSRRNSLQSGTGYSYWSIYPGQAKTFGEFGSANRGANSKGEKVSVYFTDFYVSELLADADQLKNRRLFSGDSVGNSLAESLVYAKGARVKSDVSANRVNRYAAKNEPAAPDSGGAMFSRSLGATLIAGVNNVRDVKLAAGYQVSDLFKGEGRLGYWHKSVGTMYNLAQRNAPFKRVFDSIQNFLNDVSFYAAESADLAPSILPKLDKIGDIMKSPLSPENTKALSAPVFEGTLTWGRDSTGKAVPMEEIEAALSQVTLDDRAHRLVKERRLAPNVLKMWQGLQQDQYEAIVNNKFEREFMRPGVTFTPAELAEHFNMTPEQIKLYQEFRKATDKSIDNLAISEMLNYAGDDVDPLRDMIIGMNDVSEAGQVLRDYLVSLVTLDPSRDKVLSATAAKMLDIAAHATDMKERGYAPLSRFGNYTLEATLPTGERYFSLFETDRERNKVQRLLKDAGATGVTAGTMSQESYKLLNGMSPETAALFGEMLGLDSQGSEAKDLAFQEFIKRGTANRSAMKRLLKRKGIAGFSEDAGRVLAGFIYSNARRTSSNLHSKETSSAVDAIPKQQGELKDVAVKLQEYVSSPQEEAQAFRGILFAQYLGGSAASAMVNATQPFTVTLPYLSQFGGIRKAAAQMAAAVRDANKDKIGDTRLDAALKKAEEDGIVSPQEVHALQAQAAGRAQLQSGDGTTMGNALATAGNAISKLSLVWGKVFSVAEQFNRRTTFIAAYRTAVEQGHANPAAFAEKAVSETQFVYNKGNKPRWARGVAGSILFTFKQYSVNYLELVTRMATAGEPGSDERKAGQKAALLAIAILFMMAGADGLPFVEDIQDVLDGAMQRMGYNISTKQAMKSFLATQLGKDGAAFVMNGMSGVPGIPIDVSGRLGMGNMIPGTGLFQKKTDHTRDLMELAGPGGDFVKRGFMATEQALAGDVTKAMGTISPVATRNVIKAMDMADTGMYRDDKGRKVIETTDTEAFFKGIGFQPRNVKEVQDASGEVQRAKAQYILASSEIRAKMAQAIFVNDNDLKQAVRDDIARWNTNNPGQRMTLNMPAVLSRVREMRKSKEQRMTDTAPKAIRAQVRQQLKEELQ